MMKRLLFFLAALLAGITVFAQVTSSVISGRVSDKSGPVPGAAVIVTYGPTGSTFYAVTNESGNYRVNGLTPGGPYTVTVEMLGYRKVENRNVYAPLGENVIVNAALEDESLNLDAAVFVADGNDSGMNIKRSGAGTSVSQRTMQALPTVSRSMNDVMKLTPQASTTTNGLAVGGGNYRSSYVTVDGAAFNNAFGIGSNLPAGGSPISLDAIEQMSVNITPFDVRHSGFTGGAINAVTKSGTNDFHASVYDYYTSDKVRGFKVEGEDLNRTKFLNNTVGFTVGGPIIKNRLFFFLNAEYTADTVPGSNKVVSTASGRVDPGFVPNTDMLFYSSLRPFLKFASDLLVNKYGIDTVTAGWVVSILPYGTIVLTPLFGMVYDHVGRGSMLMLVGCIIITVCHVFLALPILHHTWLASVAMFLYGISFSLVPSAMWPSVPKIVPLKQLGTAYSIIYFVQNIGLMVTPMVVGNVIGEHTDTSGHADFTIPMLVFAGLGLCATLFALLLMHVDRRKGYGLSEANMVK